MGVDLVGCFAFSWIRLWLDVIHLVELKLHTKLFRYNGCLFQSFGRSEDDV